MSGATIDYRFQAATLLYKTNLVSYHKSVTLAMTSLIKKTLYTRPLLLDSKLQAWCNANLDVQFKIELQAFIVKQDSVGRPSVNHGA